MTFRMQKNFINKETTAAAAVEAQKTNKEETLMNQNKLGNSNNKLPGSFIGFTGLQGKLQDMLVGT